ncbi:MULTISPECIES: hypothetical protein [Flavobacterium]|uniref:Uncharacterized protein n=1 Tax=Flavobacterium hankyongi TaxID=1176532 RepID=A0ABP9A4D6_9FLAO|nr:hypothetical protein [Flavobacterium sp. N1846]
MIYTIEKANLIIEQLAKFKSIPSYKLSGHFANFGFWEVEVKSALKAIDEHYERFKIMSNGQLNYIDNHGEPIHDYFNICDGVCEFSTGRPILPKRIVNSELKEKRIELLNSYYGLLVRSFNSKIIDKDQLQKFCFDVNISIDVNDLKK